MGPSEKIENIVKDMAFKAGPEMDRHLWAETTNAHNQSDRMRPASGRHEGRRRIMIRPVTKVAAVIALACALIGSLWLFDRGTAPAFGEVINHVVSAVSLSFTSRQKIGNQPVFVSKVYVEGRAIRMDMVGIEGAVPGIEKLQHEMERLNLPAFMSTVGDTARKEAVQLDHFGKTYKKMVLDDQVAAAFSSANVIEQFRDVKSEDARWLREESQGGRTIDVYLVTHVQLMGMRADLAGTEGERMTVWVYRKTGLPVKILLEAATDREGKSKDWFEFSGFTWNEPIDRSLFSLDITEGYKPAPATMPQ